LFEAFQIEYVVAYDVDVHVNGGHLVGLFQVVGNKGIRVLDAIHEIGTSLYHTLVDELFKRLFFTDDAKVVQEFVPETAVDKVTGSMFGTTHVKVNLLPVVVDSCVDQGLVVVWVHVTQVVGRGACKTRHRVQFKGIAFTGSPVFSVAQGRFPFFGRQEAVYLWQFQREIFFIQHIWTTFLVENRERFTPVTLTTENGVSQSEVNLDAAQLIVGHVGFGALDGCLDGQSVQETRVHHDALFGIVAFFADIGALDEGNDGQIEVFGESVVPGIVGGYSHDGSRAVASQDVVADPDGDGFVCEGIDGVGTGENTGDTPVGYAFAFSTFFGRGQVGIYLSLLIGGG